MPYTFLPSLIAQIAHTQSSHRPQTLLVPLSIHSEAKLSSALGIPRVGVVGVFEDAPGAEALQEYVRDNVALVDVPWVGEVGDGRWLGTRILFDEKGNEKGEARDGEKKRKA